MIEAALTCHDVEVGGLAARYASGQLDASLVAAFEEHLLLCANCQETVRMAVAIRRAETGAQRAARAGEGAPAWLARLRARPAMLAAAAVLIAAVGFAVTTNRSNDAEVRRLGVLDKAPVYQGLAVRAAASKSDSLFAAAMSEYALGRFETAADRLAAVIARGGGNEQTVFFRGASLLMLGRASEARDAFARVIAAEPNLYAAEAHYYRALSALRLGDAPAAIADLHAIPAGDRMSDRARQLLTRVEAQRSR